MTVEFNKEIRCQIRGIIFVLGLPQRLTGSHRLRTTLNLTLDPMDDHSHFPGYCNLEITILGLNLLSVDIYRDDSDDWG